MGARGRRPLELVRVSVDLIEFIQLGLEKPLDVEQPSLALTAVAVNHIWQFFATLGRNRHQYFCDAHTHLVVVLDR